MREYSFNKKWGKLLTPDIVSLLTAIYELKGKQSLLIEAHMNELTELIKVSKLQSIESSNKIDGIFTSNNRLKKLVQDKTIPINNNEKEIAGYRDMLNTIHENYDYILVNPGTLQQFYRDLYKYQDIDMGEIFRNSDNIIEGVDMDRNIKLRIDYVPSRKASEEVEAICKAYDEALTDKKMEPLILISMFILDFLCICPFSAGNGRISRLLILLLLCKNGFNVGKYISIEKIIEATKNIYYERTYLSSKKWLENENDYAPFVKYILEVVLTAYKEFSSKVCWLARAGITKGNRIEEIIKATLGTITKSEIMKKCPDISQITVQRTLIDLQNAGKIKKIGGGRYTKYIWKLEVEED